MPMGAEEIVQRIRAALPDAEIALEDLVGDQDHWRVKVTSAAFAGRSRVERHRMVMQAIGGELGGALHALSIVTSLPGEAS